MQVALSVMGQLAQVEDASCVLRDLRELVALDSNAHEGQADISRLASAGAPQQLLAALDWHVGNPEVQKVGCAALAALSANRPAVASWVVSLGGVQTVHAAVSSFAADATLALNAIRALLAVLSAMGAEPSKGPALAELHRADAAGVLLDLLEADPCAAHALSSCKALCHVVSEREVDRAAECVIGCSLRAPAGRKDVPDMLPHYLRAVRRLRAEPRDRAAACDRGGGASDCAPLPPAQAGGGAGGVRCAGRARFVAGSCVS